MLQRFGMPDGRSVDIQLLIRFHLILFFVFFTFLLSLYLRCGPLYSSSLSLPEAMIRGLSGQHKRGWIASYASSRCLLPSDHQPNCGLLVSRYLVSIHLGAHFEILSIHIISNHHYRLLLIHLLWICPLEDH